MNIFLGILAVWLVLVLVHLLFAPIFVHLRLKESGVEQPVAFYHKNIMERYKQKKKREWKGIVTFMEEDDDAFLISLLVMVGLVLLFFAYFFPIDALLIALSIWGIELFFFTLPHNYSKHLPAYTAFQGDEVGYLVHGKVLKEKEQYDLMAERLVRPESAVLFASLQPVALEVMQLTQAVDTATKVLNRDDLEDEERHDAQAKWYGLSELLKERQAEMKESQDVWLHMTGKQLHAGFHQLAEAKLKPPEAQSTSDKVVNLFPLKVVQNTFDNPALDDMRRIADDPEVDQNTRKLAKRTADEIETKLRAEQAKQNQDSTYSSAMASIVTARKIFELDKD